MFLLPKRQANNDLLVIQPGGFCICVGIIFERGFNVNDLFQHSMELLSWQKHDYLNHLQVISGLLQLGKPEDSLNYVKKVIEEVQLKGVTSKLEDTYLAFHLTILMHEADKMGITYQVELEPGEGHLIVPKEKTHELYNISKLLLYSEVVEANSINIITVLPGEHPSGGEIIIIMNRGLNKERINSIEDLGCKVYPSENRTEIIIDLSDS